MAGPPNTSVAAKLRGRPLFNPRARLDPSQVVDMRMLPMRRGIHWEDGSHSEFYPDPFPGGLQPPRDEWESRPVERPQKTREKKPRGGQARRTGLATYANQIK